VSAHPQLCVRLSQADGVIRVPREEVGDEGGRAGEAPGVRLVGGDDGKK